MRSRLKQIGTAAVIAALTVAGLSVASGGSGGDKQSSDSAGTGATFAVDGGNGNGSVNGERKHRRWRGDFADADVRAVLKDIRDAVAKQAPDIAGPVIDKAEQDGKITAAQADKLRQAAQDIADGKRPDIRGLGRDSDVQDVIHDAFAAAHDKAPAIAEPIIKKAVDDKKITAAQGDRIREMVRRGPPPHGPHGPGFGGPPKIADKDVRAVLEDIHAAVAKQAPDVVNPVIDKAEKDGKITSAQADRLRDATGALSGGKPRGAPPRLPDLRDADVREVLHDAFEALEAKRQDIAKPIIDKALADKKITEAQAAELRSTKRRSKGGGFHGRPPGMGHGRPGFGPPGGPGGGPPPAFDRPGAPSAPAAPQGSSRS